MNWDEDTLVDWAGGGTRFSLDGKQKPSGVYFAYRFDRAVVSPSREYAVIYEALGTKGLIVRGTKPVREINRSYYQAAVYEYTITLFSLPDGTQALVHCPDEYNKIEIEELESGRRLTSRAGEAVDFFHSRLRVSPGGSYLLSAGWAWHPFDDVRVFDLAGALREPAALDRNGPFEFPEAIFEIHTATFQNDAVLLLAGDNEDSEKPNPTLAGFSLSEQKTLFTTTLEFDAGTMMAVGTGHVLGLFGCPKLFEIGSGRVVREWPDLPTGQQNSSIIHHHDSVPHVALDPAFKRFAVASEKQITVVQLG